MIYLDSASTTMIAPEVLKAMMPYLTNQFGNPGTIYSAGRQALDAINKARQQVADLIGAEPGQIIFTSGGTEANNLAIHGTRKYLAEKPVIITSKIEHDSIIHAAAEYDTVYVDVTPDGVVPASIVEAALDQYGDRVGLVSIMCVNNETGVVNPVAEIAKICNKRGVLFHTDCVQAIGDYRIDVGGMGCDMLSMSAHKIHGAKGVGALFVKDRTILRPMLNGGTLQEYGIRGGTENVAGIVGFGKACELLRQSFHDRELEHLHYKGRFLTTLSNSLKQDGLSDRIAINGENESNRFGSIVNLQIRDIDAETLVLMLDAQGVCISTGSACRSHESLPSRVLVAMGLSPDEARHSVRVSFSDATTSIEVTKAAYVMAECIKRLYGTTGGDMY